MTDIKKTSITVRSDKTVGVSSRLHGANIDAIVFNVDLIAEKNPTKAVQILDLYNDVKDITPESLPQPDEDFGLAAEKINETLKNTDD
jgi:hypothetical protein